MSLEDPLVHIVPLAACKKKKTALFTLYNTEKQTALPFTPKLWKLNTLIFHKCRHSGERCDSVLMSTGNELCLLLSADMDEVKIFFT